ARPTLDDTPVSPGRSRSSDRARGDCAGGRENSGPSSRAGLLERVGIARPDAHDLGDVAVELDDGGGLSGDIPGVDHGVEVVVEELLDLPSLRERLIVAGQDERGGQYRLSQLLQERSDHGVLRNPHTDRLLLRVEEL